MNLSQMKNRFVMGAREHAPEIFMVLGVGGMIFAGVKACVDTHRKLPEAIKKRHDRLNAARKVEDESDRRAELVKAYANTGLDLAKVYGPSITICLLSSAAVFGSNVIMRKRVIALAAAYSAIDQSFREYRARVVERLGEDADQEFRYDLHKEEITEVETGEQGKERKVKKTVTVVGDGAPSAYARYFVKGEAQCAENNTDFNRLFVRQQQELANHQLRAYGFLFLNQVYDMLGIKPTVAGQSVGWVYDKADEENDNYVDFGIQEVYRRSAENPDEYEKVLLLDFNVDGNILAHSERNGLLLRT